MFISGQVHGKSRRKICQVSFLKALDERIDNICDILTCYICTDLSAYAYTINPSLIVHYRKEIYRKSVDFH